MKRSIRLRIAGTSAEWQAVDPLIASALRLQERLQHKAVSGNASQCATRALPTKLAGK